MKQEISLQNLIKKEISLRAERHEDALLINKILIPTLTFIDDHNRMVKELVRISGKHIT
jgi:hypothetical protein